MDPMTMMMLGSVGLSLLNPGGSDATKGSSYSNAQQGGFDDIFKLIEGMRGGADITKNSQFQQGNDWLMSMFNDPDFFNKFEAPLQRQFQEQTVPDLANRFAGMGSGGSTGSTAFRNQLGREASNLHTNIAALRGGMQQNAIPQLFNSAQMPFNNLMQLYNTGLSGGGVNNTYTPASNPFAPIAAGAVQGFFQGQGV